jgi:hypothetical protein
MSVELAPIISLDIFDFAVKEQMEPVEKIAGRGGTMRRIHPGKGHFGVAINRRENIPLLSLPVFYDGIQAKQKPRHRLSLKFRDLLPAAGNTALPVNPGLFCRLIVQAAGLNNALNSPSGYAAVIRVPRSVYCEEFHFAVAQMLSPQEYDVFVLARRVLARSSAARGPGSVF